MSFNYDEELKDGSPELIESLIHQAQASFSCVDSGMRSSDHLYAGHLVDCVGSLLQAVQNQQRMIERIQAEAFDSAVEVRNAEACSRAYCGHLIDDHGLYTGCKTDGCICQQFSRRGGS